MKTVLVTGRIASGKSLVCSFLREMGFDVYDCDSRCKMLYDTVPGLVPSVEEATGIPFSELSRVFSDPTALAALEALVYPALLDDIRRWKESLECDLCFIESAIALSKADFDACYDYVLVITAPYEVRNARNVKVRERDSFQECDFEGKADYTINNDTTAAELRGKVELFLNQLKNEN